MKLLVIQYLYLCVPLIYVGVSELFLNYYLIMPELNAIPIGINKVSYSVGNLLRQGYQQKKGQQTLTSSLILRLEQAVGPVPENTDQIVQEPSMAQQAAEASERQRYIDSIFYNSRIRFLPAAANLSDEIQLLVVNHQAQVSYAFNPLEAAIPESLIQKPDNFIDIDFFGLVDDNLLKVDNPGRRSAFNFEHKDQIRVNHSVLRQAIFLKDRVIFVVNEIPETGLSQTKLKMMHIYSVPPDQISNADGPRKLAIKDIDINLKSSDISNVASDRNVIAFSHHLDKFLFRSYLELNGSWVEIHNYAFASSKPDHQMQFKTLNVQFVNSREKMDSCFLQVTFLQIFSDELVFQSVILELVTDEMAKSGYWKLSAVVFSKSLNKYLASPISQNMLLEFEIQFLYDADRNKEIIYFCHNYMLIVDLGANLKNISSDMYKVNSRVFKNSILLKTVYAPLDQQIYILAKNQNQDLYIYCIDLKIVNATSREKFYKINVPELAQKKIKDFHVMEKANLDDLETYLLFLDSEGHIMSFAKPYLYSELFPQKYLCNQPEVIFMYILILFVLIAVRSIYQMADCHQLRQIKNLLLDLIRQYMGAPDSSHSSSMIHMSEFSQTHSGHTSTGQNHTSTNAAGASLQPTNRAPALSSSLSHSQPETPQFAQLSGNSSPINVSCPGLAAVENQMSLTCERPKAYHLTTQIKSTPVSPVGSFQSVQPTGSLFYGTQLKRSASERIFPILQSLEQQMKQVESLISGLRPIQQKVK